MGVVLETERLSFRHFVPGDLAELHRLYRDPEIRRYFPDGVRTRQETREELEYFLHGHPLDPRLGLWATIERTTGEFLGRSGLLRWEIDGRTEVEIAYLVAKEHWGQGYGAEAAIGLVGHAFETLGLTRVIALIDPDHEASVRTARRAGLTWERDTIMDGLPTSIYARQA